MLLDSFSLKVLFNSKKLKPVGHYFRHREFEFNYDNNASLFKAGTRKENSEERPCLKNKMK